jgi:SNF2 family DNA or RNA helicase
LQITQKKIRSPGVVSMENMWLDRYPFKNPPYAHQRDYLAGFWKRPYAALFADMGTGKTYMVINNFAMLYDTGKINSVIIIAPKGVYRNWVDIELPKHLPEHIIHRTALWTPSPRKAEKESLDRLWDVSDDLKILVMNVEALSTKKGVDYVRRFLNCTKAFVAIDESTTIKTPTAKRAKAIVELGKHAAYRRIMTGSPITRSPLDIYQQCAFLSEECLRSPSFYSFRSRYAILVEKNMGSHSFKKVVGYRKLDELKEKIKTFSYRIRKDECLDLPDKVFMKREVQLTKEQVTAYNEMKTMALAMFNDGMVTTVNALTQIMRLHQIICGHVKMDDDTVKELPNYRIQELLSVVEEASDKVIIWATYRHDIEAIKLALSKEYGMTSVGTYYGDTDDEERRRVVQEFQDPDSELRFFVGNPRTGGYGLTLTAADTVIYYSNSFDLEVRLQSEDRAHRIGQTRKVTYVDLMSPGTVDEKIVQALRDKINLSNEVMGEEMKNWLI